MKIVYVITRADTIAGAQRHVLEMSLAMLKLGHEVHVICGEGEVLTEYLQEQETPYVQLPRLKRQLLLGTDLLAIRDMSKTLKSISPDLVSAHSSKAGVISRISCAILGIPCIFTAHGWAFADGIGISKRIIYSTVEYVLHLLSRKIICVSDSDRVLAEKLFFAKSKLLTIHNSRHDVGSEFVKVHSVVSSSPIRIVMIGRLDAQKDHRTLFKALTGKENFELILVGDGPKKSELIEYSKECGIDSKVEFLGLRSDIESILSKSDIFVLISNWEGFPRSTLEAMRGGLPVIVSDVGGSKEAVQKNGYVVGRGDYVSLSKVLDNLLISAELRKEMGAMSRNIYESKYTFDRMFDATYLVYNEQKNLN